MAGFAAMKDMARSPEELKKDRDMPAPVAARIEGPTYPYGLSLCLNDETLAKLGIDGDMPDVGDMIHLVAMAKVTCASESETTSLDGGKETCRRIELQITHMACENEDEETPMRGEKWYGSADAEETDE